MDIFVDHFHDPRRSAEERIMMLVAGIAGGNAAGDLLKGDYDLGLGNTGYGAIGGIVGALILQTLIPALRGVDYGPIIGQLVIAPVGPF
jgi:hypothetical protein